MKLDFSQIQQPSTPDSVVDPRTIFSILPNKHKRYGYLRDVQSEVLAQWFERRGSRDLRLKMNTGAGKTAVGLLLLKSCLNEGVRPAVYVAPSAYLASQVRDEARALGIEVDEDPRSASVARGRAILVTYIQVLFNGQSKFGVGKSELAIGAIVIDDAHACLAIAEEQFTLDIAATHPVYSSVLDLFRRDLRAQSESSYLDVAANEPYRTMLVPFWAWQQQLGKLHGILHEARLDEHIKWPWPLLKDCLGLCRCVIGAGHIEISPRCLPVAVVPSFANARRRVFMSATFADEAILVTHFDASAVNVSAPIAPRNASDLGDRMILVPQELNPAITDDEIRDALIEKSKSVNVVVIVPSDYRAQYWAPSAQLTIRAANLEKSVERLRKEHVGLSVLVNKYDGIDLPQDACRVLVLDGLPDARRFVDRYEEGVLHGGTLSTRRAIQQIEQGMGRGVRASDDYCVVVLMGRSLISRLFRHSGIESLTPATKAQFDLSEQLAEQMRRRPMSELAAAMDYCLGREAKWIAASKSVLAGVTYGGVGQDLSMAVARRTAFDAASIRDFGKAAAQIQDEINKASDGITRGWLMAELAEYTYHINAVEAQRILQSALGYNRQVIHPQAGISYVRMSPAAADQAANCLKYVRDSFGTGEELLLEASAIAADLEFRPDSFRLFEAAMAALARLTGFMSQRPEVEYGSGPDVLWMQAAGRFVVIECKNEAVAEEISKDYSNQLGGSMNWFVGKYGADAKAVALLVHPSRVFARDANPPTGTRVMTKDLLERLKDNLRQFVAALAHQWSSASPKLVAELLAHHRLLLGDLEAMYTVPPRRGH